MNASMERQDRWTETRKKGRTRYILLNGIVLIGGFFAVGMLAVDFYFLNSLELSLEAYLGKGMTWISFTINAVIMGLLMGTLNWYGNERNFRNYSQNYLSVTPK